MYARKPSFSDLTFRDVWHLIKYYFIATFSCGLIFALPYALLLGIGPVVSTTAGIDPGSYSWWTKVVLWGVIILVLIIELPDFLDSFGRFLTGMGAGG